VAWWVKVEGYITSENDVIERVMTLHGVMNQTFTTGLSIIYSFRTRSARLINGCETFESKNVGSTFFGQSGSMAGVTQVLDWSWKGL
jgi:hypothetical protein